MISAPLPKSLFLHDQLHYWKLYFYMINSIIEIPIFTWSTRLLKSLFLHDQLHYWNPYFYMINSITEIPIFTWSAPLLKSQFLHDQLHYWNPLGRNVAAGVSGNTALVCMTTCPNVGKRLHTLPSHPVLGEPQGFNPWNANKERKKERKKQEPVILGKHLTSFFLPPPLFSFPSHILITRYV